MDSLRGDRLGEGCGGGGGLGEDGNHCVGIIVGGEEGERGGGLYRSRTHTERAVDRASPEPVLFPDRPRGRAGLAGSFSQETTVRPLGEGEFKAQGVGRRAGALIKENNKNANSRVKKESLEETNLGPTGNRDPLYFVNVT